MRPDSTKVKAAPPINPEELQPIMYWAGLSLQACQRFEYGIKVMLVALAELGVPGIEQSKAIDIIEERSPKTLGALIAILNGLMKISDGWQDNLKKGLAARNIIVHRFFTDNTELLVDPRQRPGLLKQIKGLRKEVLAGDKAVETMLHGLFAMQGHNFQKILDDLADEVRTLNARDGG